MINSYEIDYFEIIIGLVGIILGIVTIVRNRQKFNSYKEGVGLVLSGISLFILSWLCYSFRAGSWDKKYLLLSLSLKETGAGGWLCRGPAFFGYIFVIFGITIFLVARTNRKRGKCN